MYIEPRPEGAAEAAQTHVRLTLDQLVRSNL